MEAHTYVLTVAYPIDDSYESLEKTVAEMLKKTKVNVLQTDDWGQKSLAFQIKKHDEAIFKHMKLEATPAAIETLRGQLRLERGLLRWLLVTA
jgi:ribosomal protein S6